MPELSGIPLNRESPHRQTNTSGLAVSAATIFTARALTAIHGALMAVRAGVHVVPLDGIVPGEGCACGLGYAKYDPKGRKHSPGKHPISRFRWKEGASDDPEQIKQWWEEQGPNTNFGGVMGEGLAAVDVDPRNGGSIEDAAALGIPLNHVVITGGRGYHAWCKAVTKIGQRPKLPKGINLRGAGEYVVLPGSWHASGRQYQVELNGALKPFPADLLNGQTTKENQDLPRDVPEPNAVLAKYAEVLKARDFQSLYDPPYDLDEKGDWSGKLWKLERLCFSVGMSAAEVFAVAHASRPNKYARDHRPDSDLWKEVLKAEREEEPPQGLDGESAAIDREFEREYRRERARRAAKRKLDEEETEDDGSPKALDIVAFLASGPTIRTLQTREMPFPLGKGVKSYFVGPRGVLKSWLAYWIGVQIARHGGRVVIIDEENSQAILAHRLRLLGFRPDDVPRGFEVYRGIDFQREKDRKWFVEDVAARSDFVAIDTYTAVYPPTGRMNANDAFILFDREVASPATRTNPELVLVIIDHSGFDTSPRPGGIARDASAKGQKIEEEWTFRAVGPWVQVENTKTRSFPAPLPPVVLRMADSYVPNRKGQPIRLYPLGVRLLVSEEGIATVGRTSREKAIELIKESLHQGQSPPTIREVAAKLGCSTGSLRKQGEKWADLVDEARKAIEGED